MKVIKPSCTVTTVTTTMTGHHFVVGCAVVVNGEEAPILLHRAMQSEPARERILMYRFFHGHLLLSADPPQLGTLSEAYLFLSSNISPQPPPRPPPPPTRYAVNQIQTEIADRCGKDKNRERMTAVELAETHFLAICTEWWNEWLLSWSKRDIYFELLGAYRRLFPSPNATLTGTWVGLAHSHCWILRGR